MAAAVTARAASAERAQERVGSSGRDRIAGVASLTTMSDLERRGGSRLTRKQREQRAYRLVLATGAFGLIGAAGLMLAIVGIIGAGLPILALIIAAICFMLLRRTVN